MILVVDFGTTKTVAMLGSGRLVTFDGAPWLASAVLADAGSVVVGEDAVQLGRAADGLERARIGAGDAAALPVVRAVLARVVAAATEQGGEPVTELVLTHPASWDAASLSVLLSAAQGLAPRVRPVPEPVAAAAGQELATGSSLLVVDVGGGVTEVAVVRQEADTVAVLSSTGLALGGDDLDQRIVDRVLPSLRAPVDTPRDRWLLLESARAAKEHLSRHESAEVVLPDHRAVRLTRAEFERLIAEDVDRIAALATPADRVLLVGGSSRMPLLARRLTEVTGCPVLTDPEPETVVARGALRVVAGDDDGPECDEGPLHHAGREEGPLQRIRAPRGGSLVLAVVLLLVVAVTVVFAGVRPTSGRAVADRVAFGGPVAEVSMPAVPAGTELVSPGAAQFTPARVGAVVRHETAGGAMLGIRLDGYETVPGAPDGYRSLRLQFHVANIDGGDWRVRFFERVAVIDDRGQPLRPLGDGQVPCPGQRMVTVGVAADADVDVCGVVPVPDATPVLAVQFEDLRFPISVPAATNTPAPATGTSAAAVDWINDGIPMHVTADVVLTPSGYLDGPPPEPDTRFVVVRMAITVTGKRDLIPVNHPYLIDDRGALLASTGHVRQLPECRPSLVIVRAGKSDWGCYVFAIDADVPITGVTWGPDPAKFGEWPTWTVR